MSAYQRRKGATFEREIAAYLSDRLGRVVQRKLGQARDSGDDIQVGPFRIECKRRAALSVYPWLDQCLAAAGDGDIPIVVARGDGREALAIMRLEDLVPLLAGELGDPAIGEVISLHPRAEPSQVVLTHGAEPIASRSAQDSGATVEVA